MRLLRGQHAQVVKNKNVNIHFQVTGNHTNQTVHQNFIHSFIEARKKEWEYSSKIRPQVWRNRC